jgi:hypothetical protein
MSARCCAGTNERPGCLGRIDLGSTRYRLQGGWNASTMAFTSN